MRSRRRAAAVAAAVAAAALAAGCSSGDDGSAQRAAPGSPNVVVVMTDDQDVASVRVMNAVRALARSGATFENSYVTTPECCPSRATFLTGQYAHNHGVESADPPQGGYQALDGGNTLPVWLHDAGYRTAHVGKYLNGYGNPKVGGDPTEVPPGWDRWVAPVDHTEYRLYDYRLNENGIVRRYGSRPRDYQTDVLARKAVAFVRESANGGPFFLSVAPVAPHAEGGTLDSDDPGVERNPRPAPRDLGVFAHAEVPRPPSFDEADVSDKPAIVRDRAATTEGRLSNGAIEAIYRGRLESLLAVDDMVRRLRAALHASGELGRTLFVFTSDNGFLLGQHRLTGKNLPYEESTRVPLIVSGPGVPSGTKVPQLVANIDLAPTITDAAGVEPQLRVDGSSLLPLAEGRADDHERAIAIELLASHKAYRAVHTRRYVFVRYRAGGSELYDLARDPYELRNVAGDPRHAKVRRLLGRELHSLANCSGSDCRR
jgi:arylsulfatase A-like enzyme